MRRVRSLLLVALVALTSAASAEAATMFFDFGDTGQLTLGNYNNVTPAQDPILNAIDSNGAGTGVGLEIGGFNPGSNQNGTTTPGGDAAMFDAQATRDNLFGHTVNFNQPAPLPLGELLLTGLDPSTAYDFTFFSSRTGVTDNRETQHTVSGLNSAIGLLDSANNTSNVVTVPGIIPTAGGQISIRVEPGPNNTNTSGFFYLGAMSVAAVPEPMSLVMALVGVVGFVALRRSNSSRRVS